MTRPVRLLQNHGVLDGDGAGQEELGATYHVDLGRWDGPTAEGLVDGSPPMPPATFAASGGSNPADQPLPGTSPSFADQWHLHNTRQGTLAPALDLNVVRVWDDYTGKGVTVGIFDSGIQGDHPDLDQNYRGVYESYWTPNGIGIRDSGLPDTPYDNHGTATAGIIAAENNGDGGVVGVAYDATFYSIDIFDRQADGSEILHYREHMYRMKEYDIVNHSWNNGYKLNDANQQSPDPRTATFYRDIQAAADQGRHGLGTIMVVAAGNDRQDIHPADVNFSNFLNNRYSITVGAVDSYGLVTSYSNPGAAVLVSAFSAPGAPFLPGEGITTTDRVGADGYNKAADYLTDFDGTSAAAPQVSGVVALMLEANPALGWRDVQQILAYSARQVVTVQDPHLPPTPEIDRWEWNGATDWNGGGLHFSNDYGFGIVDAHAAVRLAETWTGQSTSANEAMTWAGWSGPPTIIPAVSAQGVRLQLTINESITVERVELRLDLKHARIGDVEVELVSPDGTHSMILDNRGGDWDFNQFVFTSNEFRGELSAGTWTVIVRDTLAENLGTVGQTTLVIYGDSDTANDVYVYTDEFAQATANSDHGFVGTDADGGTDTINAAAVTSSTIIDLTGNHYRIAGVEGWFGFGGGNGGQPLSHYMIENIIGGDGNDELIGNVVANRIEGGRGHDVLVGAAGDDVIRGGRGNDVIAGGFRSRIEASGFDGNDVVYGDAGDDLIMVLWGNDTVHGGDDNDTLSFTDVAAALALDLGSGTVSYGEGGTTPDADGHPIGQFGGWFTVTWDGIENLIGGTGNDVITGDANANRLDGGLGADTAAFRGARSQYTITLLANGEIQVVDSIAGRDGTDVLANIETLRFGDGDVTVSSLQSIVGTPGEDSLVGDGNANHLLGLAGNDTLIGLGGPDILDGGADVDTVDYSASSAGVSIDLVAGAGHGGDAEGDAFISVEHALGSAFDDTFRGGTSRGQFLAGDGNDTMIGGSWFDWLEGGNGDDIFIGSGGQMVMFGGDGNDRMTGSLDNTNYFDGGLGDDTMVGGNIGDYIADMTGGSETMRGGAGDDVLDDFYGHSQLFGEDGNDFVAAAGGYGLLDGGSGDDYVTAANGDYTLIGGAGADTLEFAGTGSAVFTGGTGADVFTYRAGWGPYTVTDFEDGIDRIFLWDYHYNGNVPLESLTITDSTVGAVISWNGGSQMVLNGIQASQLNAEDFVL